MIVELITAVSASWTLTKYFNDDYFYGKETAERNHTHCEFKYVGKTYVSNGKTLFPLTDATNGKQYILFKQICTDKE